MRDLIQASSLRGFDRLTTELGGDPDALLRAAGLDSDVAAHPEGWLAYSALADLLDRAATTLDRPDFGLRLARYQGIEILGAVALIARHAATATEALAGLRRYGRVYSPAFEVDVADLDERRARYTFTVVIPGVPRPAQVLELSLGVSLDLFRILLGDGWRPRCVLLPHPAGCEPSVYCDFFTAPVSFSTGTCGFDIERSDLDRPRSADDPRIRRLAEQYLEQATGATDLDTQVRELIRRCLPTGQTTVAAVAEHLRLHPRTLQRRLRDDRTSFEALLDDMRRERAEHYLRHTDRPLGQIAGLLGYSEQSALSRAARRWFDEPPRRLRDRARR